MKVLILGGTAEASTIAERLAERADVYVITSLAGRTRAPREVAGELRVGGFGGVDALADYLKEHRIDLLIDATHPFAVQISANAAEACTAAKVERLQLRRPPWTQTAADHWIEVDDGLDAAEALRNGKFRRAFLATGRQELPAFSDLADIWFLVRLVDAPAAALPLSSYEVVTGRGPFIEAEECRLLRDQKVDVIVAKNAGGSGSWPKMAAARTLGIPVIMIKRSVASDDAFVESVDEIMKRF